MLIELGILFGVYGTMAAKRKQSKKKRRLKKRKNQSRLEKKDNDLIKHAPSALELKNNRYLRFSGISVVLSGVAIMSTPALSLLSVGMLGILSYQRFIGGFSKLLKDKRISNDLVIFIGIVLGVVTAQYFALSLGMCLYYFAKKIQSKTRAHAEREIFELFDNKPRLAWLLQADGGELEVAVDELQIGDVIVINAGEVIPVDALITKGEGMVDQSILTGEAKPVEKVADDVILASTILLAGKLHAQVEKTGTETIIANIGKILNSSIEFKTDVQSKSEVWAEQAAVPFLLMGGMAFPWLGIGAATVIFRSTFSASIDLIASLEVLSHLRFAYGHGIFIKDGRALEKLHDVDAILFDKTGTLTTGSFEVHRLISYSDSHSENDILGYAAIAEKKLKHPIATAILTHAQALNLSTDAFADANYQIGYGVSLNLGDKMIQVGSERFMQAKDIDLDTGVANDMHSAHDLAHSFVLVAVDGEIAGAIELQASLRPEAHQIVSDIHKMGGRESYIVSGDHKQATAQLADELGIDHYYADVLPEDKADIVAKLQKQGKTVCFVGDGVNDSIAMSQADVSISLRGASSVATDVSQVIFMDGTLVNFTRLFELSEHLNKKLRRGLFYTMTPSGFNIASAVFLNTNLLAAIMVDYGFLMTGLLQTMREKKVEFIDQQDPDSQALSQLEEK